MRSRLRRSLSSSLRSFLRSSDLRSYMRNAYVRHTDLRYSHLRLIVRMRIRALYGLRSRAKRFGTCRGSLQVDYLRTDLGYLS